MAAISGEMEAGEANRTLGAVRARQRGSIISYYALMVAICLASGLIGWAVGMILRTTGVWPGFKSDWAIVIGIWGGLIIYLLVGRPWAVKRFRSKMKLRGFKTRFSYSVEISDEGLSTQAGQVRKTAPWSAVTEIFRVKGYWIFLVQMEPWFLPSRFLGDPAGEKAFLKEALGNLTPEARARSQEAEAFASKV